MPPLQSLKRTGNPLSLPTIQVQTLGREDLIPEGRFDETLKERGLSSIVSTGVETLQINVGRVCNQTCSHCHVDAGPDRRENMSKEIAELVLKTLVHPQIKTLDITGGAPEMNPNFRYLVENARQLNKRVIDRCNLTILLANGFTDLPEFLAHHEVEVVASLPCYLEENCDSQRGDGVFRKSIEALQRLNALGYGRPESALTLTLVYNPVGNSLPPDQESLEQDYRDHLQREYGIEFTQLFTITNLPISRYLDELLQTGQYLPYMEKLIGAFNPAAAEGVMCKSMLSVDWLGNLYDCDFNQMLEIPVNTPQAHLSSLNWDELNARRIQTANHCFGCTAGAGSSCQGSLI